MKLQLLTLSLSVVLSVNATDAAIIASRDITGKTTAEAHAAHLEQDTQWQTSAKDHAQMLEDCGQTTDYGLATD